MKLLYVYDKMPGVYQHYLTHLLWMLKDLLPLKVLTYQNSSHADYSINSSGLINKFQSFLYKIGLTEFKSRDLKIMNSFDIIHLQHSSLRTKIEPLFYRDKKPKIVITLRGGDTYMYPWLSEQWRAFYAEKSNYIDAFIVMSNHQKKYLTRWGVEEKRIHVIPVSFGNDTNAKPKFPNTKTLKLVSAFRMTWEKNIEGCVRLAKTLKDNNIPFTYDIYGDGKDFAELYFLVDKFNLNDRVHIHGKIDNDTLKQQLPLYDFFVQLSISEALSASVLEAQSVGLPCIVSDSDGLPEAVVTNKTAIVMAYDQIEDMANACVALWKDKDMYYTYSEAAIKHSHEKFSTKVEAKTLHALYTSLLS